MKFFQSPHHTLSPSYLRKCHPVVAPKVQGRALAGPLQRLGSPAYLKKHCNLRLFIMLHPIPFHPDCTPVLHCLKKLWAQRPPSSLHGDPALGPHHPQLLLVHLLTFHITSELSPSSSLPGQITNPQSNLQLPITAPPPTL